MNGQNPLWWHRDGPRIDRLDGITPSRSPALLRGLLYGIAATSLLAGVDLRVFGADPGTGALVLPRIHDPVTLNGISNEAAWSDLQPLPTVMLMPNAGAAPSERTEILVAYDDDFVYVAGRLYDREPWRIQANSKERDSGDGSSEWFGVMIDSFNDKSNALAFFTTPAGLRWDCAVLNDAEPPTRQNLSWNAFWDVTTARNGDG
ncbi:MAG: hypothetical protein HYX75_18165 [Acidobacteria bacterium]|nr:hypothetical protein [Acidobacteriota bacterium]